MEQFNQNTEFVDGNQHAPAQGQTEGGNGEAVAPLFIRGPWNAEEDAALRELINVLGEGNWVRIAMGIPGRTRKQCRERWINYLRPDIEQRDLWTEEEDRALIEAHKVYSNQWSAVARCIAGRSESSVKNHWKSTMRSLGAKRWVKKKKKGPVPFGQLTLLEEYILSFHETLEETEQLGNPGHHEVQAFPNTVSLPGAAAPFQTPSSSPEHHEVQAFPNTVNLPGAAVPFQTPSTPREYHEVMDGGPVYPNVLAPSSSYNPAEMGMYTDPTSLTAMQAMQEGHNAYNEPQVIDNYPLHQDMSSEYPEGTNINFNYPVSDNVGWQSSNQGSSNVSVTLQVTDNYLFQQDMSSEDQEGTNINFNYPVFENVGWQSPNQGSPNGFHNEAGLSSISDNAAPYDIDILQLASTELFSPEYDITLDPTEYI